MLISDVNISRGSNRVSFNSEDAKRFLGARITTTKTGARWARKTWIDLFDVGLESPFPTRQRNYRTEVIGAHVGSTVLTMPAYTSSTIGWLPRPGGVHGRMSLIAETAKTPTDLRNAALARLAFSALTAERNGRSVLDGSAKYDGVLSHETTLPSGVSHGTWRRDRGEISKGCLYVRDNTPAAPTLFSGQDLIFQSVGSDLGSSLAVLEAGLHHLDDSLDVVETVAGSVGLEVHDYTDVRGILAADMTAREVARGILELAN